MTVTRLSSARAEKFCCGATRSAVAGLRSRRVEALDDPTARAMKASLKHDLEQKAHELKTRLEHEELERDTLRQNGRQALQLADSILQSVEQSLEVDGAGALSARAPRVARLPPIKRPDSAEQ